MNLPLLLAGSLALIGAAIHGGAGELLVVRKLSPRTLPSSRFGGGAATKAMIRASWHMTTFAFITVGFALVMSGSILHGDLARGVGLVAAFASTGFALMVVGGVITDPRLLFRHPAPVLLTAVAVLAWLGIA